MAEETEPTVSPLMTSVEPVTVRVMFMMVSHRLTGSPDMAAPPRRLMPFPLVLE